MFINKKLNSGVQSGGFDRDKFNRGWMPPHPAFFCKRSVYEKYGLLNLDFPLAADYELMLRFLYKQGVSTTYIPKVLVNPVRKAPLARLDVKYLSRG